MTEVFYIMGSHDLAVWKRADGPFEEYPDMGEWYPESYEYQYYKINKVWEFPF